MVDRIGQSGGRLHISYAVAFTRLNMVLLHHQQIVRSGIIDGMKLDMNSLRLAVGYNKCLNYKNCLLTAYRLCITFDLVISDTFCGGLISTVC